MGYSIDTLVFVHRSRTPGLFAPPNGSAHPNDSPLTPESEQRVAFDRCGARGCLISCRAAPTRETHARPPRWLRAGRQGIGRDPRLPAAIRGDRRDDGPFSRQVEALPAVYYEYVAAGRK